MLKLFTAPWCGNCKGPKTLVQIRNLDVEIIDIEENPSAAQEYGIRTLPTLVKDEGMTLVVGESAILKEFDKL